MLVLSVNNTLASLDADTDERDSISTKFRDPVYWQAQNWNLFADVASFRFQFRQCLSHIMIWAECNCSRRYAQRSIGGSDQTP